MNIPDEAVEAAAKAAYIRHSDEPGFDAEAAWNDMAGTEDWECEQWESVARAALEAAAPHMLREAWDEGSVAGWVESGVPHSWGAENSLRNANPYRSAK